MRKTSLLPLLLVACLTPALASDEAFAGIVGKSGESSGQSRPTMNWSGGEIRWHHDLSTQWQATLSGAPQRGYDSGGPTYGWFAAGAQWAHRAESNRWLISLGSELRAEKAEMSLSWGAPRTSTSITRPWAIAAFGYQGIIVPFPFRMGKVAGFTRWSLAKPLWNKGGDGDEGILRDGFNHTSQLSLQLGTRF